ncbi:Magnesium transporter ALR2 [Lasiodiplodia hormozganensis]|uniref:Magnesium transporter ALR2 n=1 Tax=Lasiodiplodia hormozganensis TaxID=869390 RepID=A0AA40CMW9_9PEZI|nr:Magnesium transporter ALR2 [Lasiodiplodia hormozganensis]
MASRDYPGESSTAPTAPRGSAAPAQPSISSVMAQPTASDSSRTPTGTAKKRKHRGGKKRRRRQSFAAPPSEDHTDVPSDAMGTERPSLADVTSEEAVRSSFYRLRNKASNTSLESEALLDHRDQGPLQTRRHSIMQSGFYSPRSNQPYNRSSPSHRPSTAFPFPTTKRSEGSRTKLSRTDRAGMEDEDSADDQTPLMGSIKRDSPRFGGYGGLSSIGSPAIRFADRVRRRSSASSHSSRRRRTGSRPGTIQLPKQDDYDVNNPPSVPGSPRLESDMGFDDVMLTGEIDRERRGSEREPGPLSRDVLIEINDEGAVRSAHGSAPGSPRNVSSRLDEHPAERDVCFPQDLMSDIGREEYTHPTEGPTRTRRRRKKPWPNLSSLEEWAAQEKEQRTIEGIRARKVSEPLFVDGRLRPQKRAWHREDDDAPFRFTYFNEEFQSTLHSHTLSELLQEGQTFRDLFIPEPPILSDDSDDEDDVPSHANGFGSRLGTSPNPGSLDMSRQTSRISNPRNNSSGETTGEGTPTQFGTPKKVKEKRYGARPVFWLDVLSPTEAEMKVLTRAFGIHPLTHEDVMMQEQREKVELFHNYYFVNYRTFEQDTNSEDYLEPVNIYFIVFREGVISIHFSMTPHMANVRRRIRQLRDYLILSSDWIAYAIIDDITDVYAPLIQSIEDEVDDIDDHILRMHTSGQATEGGVDSNKLKRMLRDFADEKQSEHGDGTAGDSGGNMLRRVGETRKKVMALYRLLGNKADVIKGFAKRCNEQWEVAPKTEIGLYLGDIQDHIVTMTGNLSHYESLLSRAHGNYLAQINIRMNERAEQTNDVLGKLTVLGTIVLPMNIITGMWGMNVQVPGQEVENLYWFWAITAFLIMFGITCFFICKRVYGVV